MRDEDEREDAPERRWEPSGQRPGSEPPRTLEALFQELVRRGAALGFSSFFLTEEAVRRAFSERVPSDWVDYVGRQSDELRAEVVDRVSKEFGQWLRGIDLVQLADEFLDTHEISATIELKATRKSAAEDGASPSTTLQIVTRKK